MEQNSSINFCYIYNVIMYLFYIVTNNGVIRNDCYCRIGDLFYSAPEWNVLSVCILTKTVLLLLILLLFLHVRICVLICCTVYSYFPPTLIIVVCSTPQGAYNNAFQHLTLDYSIFFAGLTAQRDPVVGNNRS